MKNSESGGAGIEFLAPFKQRLIADADAEKRFAGLDEIARGFEQFLFAQGVDAIVERADAGQHHRAGIADLIRRCTMRTSAPTLSSDLWTLRKVAGAIIKQGNHGEMYTLKR